MLVVFYRGNKMITFKAMIIAGFLILSLSLLNGCVTIVCNSTDYKAQSEVFTDEATKNQAEKINNDGGLL